MVLQIICNHEKLRDMMQTKSVPTKFPIIRPPPLFHETLSFYTNTHMLTFHRNVYHFHSFKLSQLLQCTFFISSRFKTFLFFFKIVYLLYIILSSIYLVETNVDGLLNTHKLQLCLTCVQSYFSFNI